MSGQTPDPPHLQDPAQRAGTLRGVSAALVALLRTRAALAGLELREEGQRVKRLLVLAVLAFLFASAALLLLAGLVVAAFWDTHRLLALGAMTVIYGAIAWFLLDRAGRAISDAPLPFSATVGELEQDLAVMQARHE